MIFGSSEIMGQKNVVRFFGALICFYKRFLASSSDTLGAFFDWCLWMLVLRFNS
jgi:hypothetical protein